MRTILHPFLLVAAGCSLSALAAAPALAKTCPSGQFLQVSKGKCISKDSARYLGIAGRLGFSLLAGAIARVRTLPGPSTSR